MRNQQITPFHFDPLDVESQAPAIPAITAPDVPDPAALSRAECDAIREAARREGFAQGHTEGVEAGHAAGYAESFAQGSDTGHQEGMRRAEAEVALLSEAARQWRDADASIAAFLERAVLQLSLDVARQVIRKEVSAITAEDLKARLAEMTRTLRLSNISVTWALHPDQIATLEAHLAELPAAWTFHADDRMALGGVRVRTQWPDTFDGGRTIAQEWDARIETRWSEVVARILDGD
ncbi:FliH/SctL family protein [Acidithiobacillus ferrooxidans]|uniref:FliH/SctL family protein n=1 Tax=Acidithiobacillus ferrooxidans TaxID=920 RepID=UPI00214A8F70|nr:FliH/SctL family protein [Acidithiobacillus ferrooxidans]MCR2831272.1 FliH/SctL family protein [Acidithiobacillus ferrooxidans]